MPANKAIKPSASRLQLVAATLLAAALLGWAAYNAYERYRDYASSEQIQVESSPAKPTSVAQPKDTRSVARLYLFGRKQVEARPIEVTRAPATRLNLTLIGVIAATEEQVSKAIIQVGNANVGVYSVGEDLPGTRATVDRIEKNQVLLRRNGKLESLAIVRPELPEERKEID
jgi:type II secretory pathway component PulC